MPTLEQCACVPLADEQSASQCSPAYPASQVQIGVCVPGNVDSVATSSLAAPQTPTTAEEEEGLTAEELDASQHTEIDEFIDFFTASPMQHREEQDRAGGTSGSTREPERQREPTSADAPEPKRRSIGWVTPHRHTDACRSPLMA